MWRLFSHVVVQFVVIGFGALVAVRATGQIIVDLLGAAGESRRGDEHVEGDGTW